MSKYREKQAKNDVEDIKNLALAWDAELKKVRELSNPASLHPKPLATGEDERKRWASIAAAVIIEWERS